MNLAELCIRRPILASVLNILVVLIGVVSYQRLGTREYPNIDEPAVTVETKYLGASAQIIESQVSKVLEDSISGIEGINYMTSISRSEQSQITILFRVNRDVDAAASDVRDRVSRVRGSLPDEIDEPIIQKVEADAQPIIYLAFSSDRHSELEVSDFADRYVKDRLQTLPGVAQAQIFAERRYAMRIWLDNQKLAARNLTVQDVETALRHQNVEIPAGRIESRRREFTVVAESDLRTPEQFAQLILKNMNGYLVRLSDVGRAEYGARDDRLVARYNRQNAIAIGVVKQSTANPLEVSQAVQAALPEIERALPDGMKVEIAYDSSIFIAKSIEAVYHTIAEAIGLVFLVVLFFLRTFRATLIPLLAIPVSLIGACALMLMFGFSINTLTLLAMVLAIGLVVDDAIVMLENIYRHIEEGMRPIPAAIKGAKEIAFAVLAMTVTLAAVYAPMGFTQGRVGKLFVEFALTLAGAVVVSGFVALTLTPALCSRLLRHKDQHNFLYNGIGHILDGLDRGYRSAAAWSVRWRVVPLVGAVLVAAVTVCLFRGVPGVLAPFQSEISPVEDRGFMLGFSQGSDGTTVPYQAEQAQKMEGVFFALPERERVFLITGFPVSNQSLAFLSMKDWDLRTRKPQQLVPELMPKLFGGIPALMAFPILPPSLGQSLLAQPVEIAIQTTSTYEELAKMVDSVMAEVAKNPGIQNMRSDLELKKPEIRVTVDRAKAADLGIEVDTIGRTLESMLGGRQVTRFKREGQQYDVMVKIEDDLRRTPEELTGIYVRAASGAMVPLSNLVTIRETVAPRELNHFNKLRAAKLSANLAPTYAQGEALAFMEQTIRRLTPAGTQIDYSGPAREYRESSNEIYFIFALAVAFIFLVLAAQFESIRDPVIIMLTVPLAMCGAFIALRVTGTSLNIYSQIGLVTLVGLITKHGILIVEFANQQQDRGLDRVAAVVEAAALRLRPILMTTLAMVLGAIPLALATGAGAESRRAIGWVIVGGMSFGTLLTLFVLPSMYLLLNRHSPVIAEDELEESVTPPLHATRAAE